MMSRSLEDGIYVVTGATSGIGLAVGRAILERGGILIGIGRSPERCAHAERTLKEDFPGSKIAYLLADLALQREVRQLIPTIQNRLEAWDHAGLDGLINNAGAFTFWRTLTEEGFETQWALNHLAPFLLTLLLLPALQASPGARVITVSSGSHREIALHWDDLEQKHGFYNPLRAYKQSKLANVLFTLEFNRRYGAGSKLVALAADPGLTNTGMGEKTGFPLAGWYWRRRRQKGIPPKESAAGIVSLLNHPEAGTTDEIYWKHGIAVDPDPNALDVGAAKKLWDISTRMCGLTED